MRKRRSTRLKIIDNKVLSETCEYDVQSLFVSYLRINAVFDKYLIAIPNEGYRTKSFAGRLAKMGLKRGAPDLFFFYPRYGLYGLAIEFKYAHKGKLSDEQRVVLSDLYEQGYGVMTPRDFNEAVNVFFSYLTGEFDERYQHHYISDILREKVPAISRKGWFDAGSILPPSIKKTFGLCGANRQMRKRV